MTYSLGKTAFDVNIGELDDTPWRRAGVDISAFFNYGVRMTIVWLLSLILPLTH